MAENASPDFTFRAKAQIERLIELSENADIELDPIVFENLNEVAQRLSLDLKRKGPITLEQLGAHPSKFP